MKLHSLVTLTMILMATALPCLGQNTGSAPEGRTASISSIGQSRSRQQTSRPRGSIRGRVVGSDGQPMVNARVFLRSAGSQLGPARNTTTDEKGEFQVDDLGPSIYTVGVYTPGYVDTTTSMAERYLRSGDSVTIVLTKGSVITGTVTGMDGEPVVAVSVRAIQVRDADGRPFRIPRNTRLSETDDRGVYRLYGLSPGSYIVIAQGPPFSTNQLSAYTEDAPTYYPSATRDTASEVAVSGGQEVTGIDIRYRGDKGSAISGSVTGSLPSDRTGNINVNVVNAATGTNEYSTFIPSVMASRTFAIYGIPDGEYELFAQSFSSSQGGSKSPVRRLQVKGADVTGIELSLAPAGSISGLVTVEALADASVKEACKKNRSLLLEENLFAVLRDDKTEESRPGRTLIPVSRDLVPGDRGEFRLMNVDAGRYRFEPRSVGDSLYIRSITLASENKNSPPQDVSANGLNVRLGEQVKGLIIALSEGGASIEGRVVQAAAKQAPSAVRVYLIPA
ncbi:MAG TPA: carboxypeptidase-like regulatory domain-containing protein, partial [Blastocatellia bacterium]|nr:carboxypeptidase-like regulatory domain-containing protein [Blastocatellia bacterium]